MVEMYIMALQMHAFFSLFLLLTLGLNGYTLLKATDLQAFRRTMMLFLTPLHETTFAFVVFTGLVMMVTKHLEFSVANIVMSLASVVFVVLEVKRLKPLKHLTSNRREDFEAYKKSAFALLVGESAMFVAIIVWMWMWMSR